MRHPATIRWNAHQVPFIRAETDHDLAVALGLVHVHLRWTQLELMRRVVYGRLSELIGPFGLGMDRMLRTLDLPKAVLAIDAGLPDETRAWIEAFVSGMNATIRKLPALPPEFRLLGLSRTPWTLRDVLALTRLAAFDVTWVVWMALLPQRGKAAVEALWRRQLDETAGFDLADASEAGGLAAWMRSVLMRFSRPGSNSWAVARSRSASGGAWMANDTHLSPLLPNLWLIAGGQSPSFHMTGLMVPGVPAMLIGRNPWIAWGGTNLHAASSDLFDVSDLPESAFATRSEVVTVRGAGRREIRVRDTEYGPVISDLPRLRKGGGVYALRWMGHRASDEVSGLMGMNRARDWESFRAALNRIGVPGQNILYADAAGHIGQAMAAHLPARPPQPSLSPLLPRELAAAWDRIVPSDGLPSVFDPPEGFVASANNKPPDGDVLVGYFFSSNQRINRLRELLGQNERVDFETLARMQRDVFAHYTIPTKQRLAGLLREMRKPETSRFAQVLEDWDGEYDADSQAPLIFELTLYHLGLALHGKRMLRLYSSVWNTRGLLRRDLEAAPAAVLARAVRRAVPALVKDVRRYRTWGTIHRLEPRHVMAGLPVAGRYFRFTEWPASGGNDTVMKTGHGLSNRPHHVTLASTARHLSELSDIDSNWFVLLGGQDGWLGSSTLVDQTEPWRQGRYIQVPLRWETVERSFLHCTELRP